MLGDNLSGLIAAIRLALATLDRIAGRTTVPSAPPAADGTSIGLTHAALHRIARRAAVPSSPAIAVAIAVRRRTVSRRRVIVLCIDYRRAADGCSGRSDRPSKRFLFLRASQSSQLFTALLSIHSASFRPPEPAATRYFFVVAIDSYRPDSYMRRCRCRPILGAERR